MNPANESLANEEVNNDYIALVQNLSYQADPLYLNKKTRANYLQENNLNLLRPYQLNAIHALQKSAADGNRRYLFEMATGTGKTLISAAVIRLFLRTGNARRVLFLVDRIELEEQARKNFRNYLAKDYDIKIYKEGYADWAKADIVVSTVQTLSNNDKYKKLFSPTDFDLLIVDESHRSINGNARAVFEYFDGYKLGLTATPKDYIKNIDEETLSKTDPRLLERRALLDTYNTFGCKSGMPTFRYSLQDGVNDGYLINPYILDIKTDITTELLSLKGHYAVGQNEVGDDDEAIFGSNDFERHFFNENINFAFCKTFLENAERDPISGEIGKSLIFCINQKHAAKITQTLNKLAMKYFPGIYNSDFAKQVTSSIPDAQNMTRLFTNNNLCGHSRFYLEEYETSKTRICVTVNMMTTGYDCPDLLNLAFMRPIFSPSDFIQMKGRGTRKYTFRFTDSDKQTIAQEKTLFKLFDFFQNCTYFEKDFEYHKKLKLPLDREVVSGPSKKHAQKHITSETEDKLKTIQSLPIPPQGMRVDREFFNNTRIDLQNDQVEKAYNQFISLHNLTDLDLLLQIKRFFQAYLLNHNDFRNIVETKENLANLWHHPGFDFDDYKKLNKWPDLLLEFIQNNLDLD